MPDDTRSPQTRQPRIPWNKGKLTGPKPPLKVREIWAIRIRLQLAERLRDLALFDLAIDSKLRGCDLVALHVYRPRFPGHVVEGKSGRLPPGSDEPFLAHLRG